MSLERAGRGFTLIELMIVVAIIAILAAIAIPAYQDYTIRSQLTEGLSLATGAKSAIWDFTADKGYFPPNNTSAGLASPVSIAGSYVASVTVTNGLVKMVYGNRANTALGSKTLNLSPRTSSGAITWSCKSSDINSKYMPTTCR